MASTQDNNPQLEAQVLDALRTVQDPDLGKDLVTLGMIRDLRVQNGLATFRVVLTTPACPLKAKIEADCRQAVGKVSGVQNIEIKMDSEVRNKSQNSKNTVKGVQNIIAVSSGKGGVGKSTVAANLAVSLALDGARVGLMDADIYGPNMPTMMGVLGEPKIEQDEQGKEFFIPPSSHGVKVMSMGFLIDGDQPMIWRGPMLHNVVNQFCHMVRWGELDYLVVDMPPGTGDVQLSLAQLVPVTGTVMVSTPQEVSMQDVRKGFLMWEKVKVPVLGFVENMSYFVCDGCEKKHFIFGTGGGELLSKKFRSPLLGQIPIVNEIRAGGDEGTPIVVRNPNSPVALSFRDLARKIAQSISIAASKNVDPTQLVQIGTFN